PEDIARAHALRFTTRRPGKSPAQAAACYDRRANRAPRMPPSQSPHESARPPERAAEERAEELQAVELRLAIGKDGLGLELARPPRVACFDVTDLAATLPAARFPLDVSGGVSRFRHRRGELSRVELELRAAELERWAAPRLSGIVGPRAPELWVAARR